MPTTWIRSPVDLLLLVVAGAWGSTYLVSKDLLTGGSVLALAAFRLLLAAAVMVLIVAGRRRRPTVAELRVGAALGVILGLVFAFEMFGIAHTSATNAGVIISLTMIFTPLLEAAIGRRPVPRQFLLAGALAVCGVVLLAGNGSFQPPRLGDGLMLMAAVARAFHVATMHRLTKGRTLDSLHLTTVQLATGAVLFTLASAMSRQSVTRYASGLGAHQVLLLAYLVLACTVFAFLVQTWAVRRTSPSRVSLLLGTEPVFAAAIGITIGHAALEPIGWCGIVCVLAGTAWGRAIDERRARVALSDCSRRARI